jgi:hypothetical protein
MTTFRSWLLTQKCTIDTTMARTELGYAPTVTRDQGLAALTLWIAPNQFNACTSYLLPPQTAPKQPPNGLS